MKQVIPASITGLDGAPAASVLDHRFGESDPFTLGVEEEYMLLDPASFDLVQHIETVLDAVQGDELADRINAELMQSRKSAEAPWEPDPFLLDERMLVARVRGLGLIVFSTCSHSGIVNVCTHVKTLFPDVPIHTLMGGLHLGGVMERNIPDTVDGLRPFDIRHIIAGHCTGWRALHALAGALGDSVSQSAVGTTYTFSAEQAA